MSAQAQRIAELEADRDLSAWLLAELSWKYTKLSAVVAAIIAPAIQQAQQQALGAALLAKAQETQTVNL